MGLPDYELVKVTGKAHRQTFEVRCKVGNGIEPTTGQGTSRRDAEQASADRMLSALGRAEDDG